MACMLATCLDLCTICQGVTKMPLLLQERQHHSCSMTAHHSPSIHSSHPFHRTLKKPALRPKARPILHEDSHMMAQQIMASSAALSLSHCEMAQPAWSNLHHAHDDQGANIMGQHSCDNFLSCTRDLCSSPDTAHPFQ